MPRCKPRRISLAFNEKRLLPVAMSAFFLRFFRGRSVRLNVSEVMGKCLDVALVFGQLRRSMLSSPLPNSSDELDLLRPAERVLRFLSAEFERAEAQEGGRLPSVRQLAGRLKVSTATVQSVFQKLAEEGKIRSEVGNGSFWLAPPKTASRVLRVGINLADPLEAVPAVWLREIYGGMLHALLQSKRPMVLRPIAGERAGAGNEEDLDGLIIFPQPGYLDLRARWEKAGRALMSLNPPDEMATANFISPDYFGSSRRLGEVWKRSGRRRIWLLMNPQPEISPSVRLRCGGFAAGLGEALGRGVEMSVFCVSGATEQDGYGALGRLLSECKTRPDAIYCAGDALAVGVVRRLADAGVDVPAEVSVVGGNGLGHKLDSQVWLTAMRQPFAALGEALVDGLVQRIGTGVDCPGKFLPVEFVAGTTTRDCENELWASV